MTIYLITHKVPTDEVLLSRHISVDRTVASQTALTLFFDLSAVLRSLHKLRRESSNSMEFYVTRKFIALLRNVRHTYPLHTLSTQVRHILTLASPPLSGFEVVPFLQSVLQKNPTRTSLPYVTHDPFISSSLTF